MDEILNFPIKNKESNDGENSFISFGSCSMQGWRVLMEDTLITDISQGENNQYNIFGVFDGHGGFEVSEFVKRHFTNELISNNNFKSGNIKLSLKETFLKMDSLMLEEKGIEELKQISELNKNNKKEKIKFGKDLDNDSEENDSIKEEEHIVNNIGCTGCVCIIDEKNKKLYFANSGDSRVILYKNKKEYQMSIDHTPNLPEEKERIYNAKGWVMSGRVNNDLSVSRGFGDFIYKNNNELNPENQIITANPDILIEDLNNECDFVVIACDGIWECLSNIDVCNFIQEKLLSKDVQNENFKLSGILESLFDNICAKDLNVNSDVGFDNMSCIIIQFKK